MALAFFVPSQGLPLSSRKAIEQIQSQKAALAEQCAKAVSALIDQGHWNTAIAVAIDGSRLSQADIARELRVMRSTVARWLDGSAAPLNKAIPQLEKKLVAAIRKSG